MRYCVIKNTTKVIDGSENPDDIMFQNAQSAGFTESEVEILTEAEYQARKATEPKPPQLPTAEERLEALEFAMLELVLGGAE
jgi:hypothetical protein